MWCLNSASFSNQFISGLIECRKLFVSANEWAKLILKYQKWINVKSGVQC